MKTRFPLSPSFLFAIQAALVFYSSPLSAAPITWDNTSGDSKWSTATNWDTNTEPTSVDDLTFPLGLAGPITLISTENAKSLQFDGAYTLSGGILALAAGSGIGVTDGVTATIDNAMTITGVLSKNGNGTLVLGATNTNPGGTIISAGKIRVALAGALGTTGIITTVNGGTTLEVATGITFDRPITLMNTGTVAGLGTAISNGVVTIDAAATSVTLGTSSGSDVLTLGNTSNDLTGGTASTVINIGGPGAVRLAMTSNFPGSWNIPNGKLELANAAALGSAATSVTLSGGTLAGRAAAAVTFTGPAGNILVTADSTILSDRSAAAAAEIYTFGTLSIGSNVLNVSPGVNATSGTAGIVLGNINLTGNPSFVVNDSGATIGKLTTGSLLGGGIARTITKTGTGDLAVTGGSTNLLAASAFSASGGGTIEMLFPDLGVSGVTTPVAITAAQNPFGSASISVTDGALRLLATGAGTNATAVQSFQLPSSITLGGDVTLDPDRRTTGSAKTFELTGLTLASGTVLSMAGDNTYGVRVTGPLVLQGNATLKGIDTASKDGLLNLAGGISGGPSTALTIGGGTSPLNLTIGAASTFGGGTTMSGGTVTLTAANALGPAPVVLNGGTLIVSADDALNGTVTVNGGILQVNDTDALESNAINVNGGTLYFRNDSPTAVTTPITTGQITVAGSGGISISNNGTGSAQQLFSFPQLNFSGNTTFNVAAITTSFIPVFQNIALTGNLTLSNTQTARIQNITEDVSPRTLIKAGIGILELEGDGNHSGGTEVIAGTLLVKSNDALGSGALTLGDTSGSVTAIAQFNTGLTISNNLVARLGSIGLLTLHSPNGGVTWNGVVDLQRTLTLDNGSSSVSSTLGGQITGLGGLSKIGTGEIVLTNATNSFGNGTATSITVADGTLTVASDGALGNPLNGVTMTGDGLLKIDGTFATSRTLTVTATGGVNVTGANVLTVNSPISGVGAFLKTGPGIMTIAPGVDSSARSSSTTSITDGILRVQGVKNLSDTGNITFNGSAGTVEFLRDANTTFPYPVSVGGTGTIRVDRASGGVATNGRHTLGSLTMTTGNLTVTGANGYGLTFGEVDTTGSSTISNNAPGELVLTKLTGNASGTSLVMTLGGSGDIRITGALTTGDPDYGITKTGSGTARFGTSVVAFSRAAIVNDGTLDLNNLTYTVNALTMGGTASALGAQLVTGVSGSLALGGTLSFSNSGTPAGGTITGALNLGALSRSFAIGDSSAAPVDLTIAGIISGSAGAAIDKSGTGTLRFSGAGNTQPGLVTVSAGVLELGKSSGDAIGTGGLNATGGIVRLVGSEQINNAASVSLNSANEVSLELGNFTETVGPLSLTQTDVNDYTAVKTGATGTLVLGGNLTFNNNVNSASNDERNVLITGTGGEFTPATDGTLDLGGATRTITVATNVIGVDEPKANATIETRIINGSILKTGPRTLYLTNPNNTFNGGLQIGQGFIRPGSGTSLGLGTVTFTNAPGVPAGIDFGSVTGTLANPITTGSGGTASFIYSAASPGTLVLSSGFNIAQELIIDVTNGTVIKGSSAVLDVTGLIDDAAGTFGLRKRGNGTLKLAAGNTYGGGTIIEKGILAIPANNALGNTIAPLTLDGGCLANSGSFILTRDLTITPNGGNIRSNEIPQTLEISGSLAWSSGTTTIDGSGRTVISGTTTSVPTSNLVLGAPIAFATGIANFNSWNSRVCLQGPATLPDGNLSITNFAVLELGNGNFTRALGTGPSQVQLPTSLGGGWAAVGADRSVNIGGASAPLLWGQTSPVAFLYNPAGGVGALVLGSISGTHTVEFQNPLDFNNSLSSVSRSVITNDGEAIIDARITGDLGLSSALQGVFLELTSNGTLEITGDIIGPVSLTNSGAGRTILSGNNDLTGEMYLTQGTLELANDASFGAPSSIYISSGASLDATAVTVPVTTPPFGQVSVDGNLIGDVNVNGSLDGNGQITGNVTVPAGSEIFPSLAGTLHIGGNLTCNPSSGFRIDIQGTTPESGYNRLRVSGGVNLAGFLNPFVDGINIPPGFTGTLPLILNDGSDPINGTFFQLSEGSPISISNDPFSRTVQVTYLANGDGGPVGNDFGVTFGNPGSTPFDTWINTFTSLTNPADKTKAANPDRDVLNNLGEFALDGNPTTGTSSGKIVGKIALVGGVNTMTLTIPVRTGTILAPGDPVGGELVLKNTADALTYRLQASDNLTSFALDVTEVTGQDAADIQNGLLLPPLTPGGGWIYRTFRSPGPVLGDPSEFMRVQISE